MPAVLLLRHFNTRIRILVTSACDIHLPGIMVNIEEKHCSAKETGEMASEAMQREHCIHPLSGRTLNPLAENPFSSYSDSFLSC